MSTMSSVLYDAVVVPCGPDSTHTLAEDGNAVHFVAEAYKHAKAVAAFGTGRRLLEEAGLPALDGVGGDSRVVVEHGVATTSRAKDEIPDEFVDAIVETLARHRAWDRPLGRVPA
jgi:catalase